MAKPIKITIKGTDNHGDDAPRVEDLFAQVLDQVKILQELENVVTGKASGVLDWRVTNVTKNSPTAFELVPCAKDGKVNIDDLTNQVVSKMASGLQQLGRGGERPAYFSNSILKKIKTISERVTNGLASTEIDFSGYGDAPSFFTNQDSALTIVKNIKNIITPASGPYRELGSIEGYVKNIGRDGSGRPFVILTARLDNSDVHCTSSSSGLAEIENLEVKHVIEGLRLRVYGILHYKALGVLKRVDVERVERFPDESELPTIEDLIDPDFTNGVDSVEYIRRKRDNV